MASSSLPVSVSSSSQDLLQAHLELWHQAVSYTKSVALAVALDLGIADAVHRRGGSATLPEILAEVGIHPCKLRGLRRLMRVLAASGTFSASSGTGLDAVYGLTPVSSLLVSRRDAAAAGDETISSPATPPSLAPFMGVNLHPILVSPLVKAMMAWFRLDQPGPSPFAVAYGEMVWERTQHDAELNALVNRSLVADSRFLRPIFLKECGEVFDGVDSLVDVGGGLGGAAAAIAAAFPHIKCSVLDLPQVVANVPASQANVEYVPGDMFESIPLAKVIFLKSTLHDWADDECVKILKNCKKAVAPRDEGGKIVIIDMVVGYGPQDIKHKEAQVFFDFYIMFINGAERDEQEWKDIFTRAGFVDYKIVSVLGVMSIIELYT